MSNKTEYDYRNKNFFNKTYPECQKLLKYICSKRKNQLTRPVTEIDYHKFRKLWYNYFSTILKNQKFNQVSIDQLFGWGNFGHNWKTLHDENDKDWQHDKTKKQLFDSFYAEVYYISDRMSLDRLFRTHWLFNKISNKHYSKEVNKIYYPNSHK